MMLRWVAASILVLDLKETLKRAKKIVGENRIVLQSTIAMVRFVYSEDAKFPDQHQTCLGPEAGGVKATT